MKKFTLRMSLIMLLCAIAVMGMKSFAQEAVPKTKVPGAPYKQSDYPPLRTGGENMASAVVINALPFTDGGTTCGAANDYSAVCGCCGGSTTAPDLVYSYTPSINGTITISLEGTYDTFLHVRDSDGNVIACDDDSGGGLFALISNLAVNQDETYFIVVEGWASFCGEYSLSVSGTTNEVPVSGWAIGIAIFLIGTVALVRYIKLT